MYEHENHLRFMWCVTIDLLLGLDYSDSKMHLLTSRCSFKREKISLEVTRWSSLYLSVFLCRLLLAVQCSNDLMKVTHSSSSMQPLSLCSDEESSALLQFKCSLLLVILLAIQSLNHGSSMEKTVIDARGMALVLRGHWPCNWPRTQ